MVRDVSSLMYNVKFLLRLTAAHNDSTSTGPRKLTQLELGTILYVKEATRTCSLMTSRLVVSEEGVSYGGPQKLRPALGELSGVVGDREPMNVELFVVNSVDEFSLSRRSVNPWGVGTRAPRRPVPLDGAGRDGNNHRRPYPVRVWEGSASTTRGLSPPTVRQGRRHIMSSFTL